MWNEATAWEGLTQEATFALSIYVLLVSTPMLTGMKFAAFSNDFALYRRRSAMLEELGTTPEQVADSLRRLGIRGVRNAARYLNPIVRYATSLLDNAYAIDLMQGDRLRIVFASGEASEIPIPEPVLEFLNRFHRGQYPDLEMTVSPG